MTCRRAFDADLPALLRGDGGDPDFQAHYPACPECAAEVGVWRELDALLRVGTPAEGWHPAEEELLAFIDQPTTLSTVTRAALEQHLAGCRPCADEMRVLRRVEAPSLADAATVTSPAAPPVSALMAAERRGRRFGRLIWHPVFAYALVVVLLIPVVRDQIVRFSSGERAAAPASSDRVPVPAAPAEQVALAPSAPAGVAPLLGASAREALPLQPAPVPPAAAEPKAKAASARQVATVPEVRERLATLRNAPVAAERQPGKADDDTAALQRKAGAPPAAAAPAAVERALSLQSSGDTVAPSALRPVLAVGPDAHPAIPFTDAERGPLLQIAAPAGIGDGPVDVRVRGRSSGREIFERLTVNANTIELEIPPRWLAPGEYVVTVGTTDLRPHARKAETATGTLGFSVHAPIATNAAR